MGASDGKFVVPNADVIWSAIKKSGIPQDRLSVMVLGKNSAYISQALSRGSFERENLKKLCEFLGINYDDAVVKVAPKEDVAVASNNTEVTIPHLETLIVGMNTMYEMQKEYSATMKDLLVEIRALNTKQNRIENALGQLVQNSIITKENTNKICDSTNAVRSQLNLANGRLKDLVDGVKKNEKTYKVV